MSIPKAPTWSPNEKQILSDCISKLIRSGAISLVNFQEGQFLSNVFTVPKPDGSYRLVINLKSLNTFVKANHFKLEDQKTVSHILQKSYFLATLDLKDAYFLIPVDKKDRKYLRFHFDEKLFQFNCLPFGLNCAPLVFTKLMKPLVALLRHKGFLSVLYLDDFLLLGSSYNKCQQNISATITTLEKLGFIINYKKSMLVPSRTCQYLGFIYNSINLSISIPDQKKVALLKLISNFLKLKSCPIRTFAQLVGKLVSICPAVPYGWLHLKPLERVQFLALQKTQGRYNKHMIVPSYLSTELNWWITKIPLASNTLRLPSYHLEIFSDASLSGWGVFCNGTSSYGFWSQEERKLPINYLELKAAFFGLKCFAFKLRNKNILLRIDNTTAIAFINKMGGIRFQHLSLLCKDIWAWCENKNIHIHASYISSDNNKEADSGSRQVNFETEWELNDKYFTEIKRQFFVPEIDLFASRLNAKCKKFISWHRDPEASYVDAFTVDWSKFKFYAFPPFSVIFKCLQKIISEGAKGILVVPRWPTQPWYPVFQSMLTTNTIILEPNIDLLFSIDRTIPHPLWPQLTLEVGVLSGKLCK